MFRFWSRVRQSTPEEALASLRGDGLLIDVRSPDEFSDGYARGARSIPPPRSGRTREPDPDAEIRWLLRRST